MGPLPLDARSFEATDRLSLSQAQISSKWLMVGEKNFKMRRMVFRIKRKNRKTSMVLDPARRTDRLVAHSRESLREGE